MITVQLSHAKVNSDMLITSCALGGTRTLKPFQASVSKTDVYTVPPPMHSRNVILLQLQVLILCLLWVNQLVALRRIELLFILRESSVLPLDDRASKIHNSESRFKKSLMWIFAENAGFEPAVPFYRDMRLANAPLKPLEQSS